jgi:hypothetical protein
LLTALPTAYTSFFKRKDPNKGKQSITLAYSIPFAFALLHCYSSSSNLLLLSVAWEEDADDFPPEINRCASPALWQATGYPWVCRANESGKRR